MAFVVPTKRGGYEIRESHNTPKGPRSRTLASFRELDDTVIRKARERAARPPEPEDLRQAAIRAGAPVAEEPVDRAARETLRLLAGGAPLDPMLRRLLLGAFQVEERRAGAHSNGPAPEVSDAARSATQWIGATLEARGEALSELLDLADALPFEIRSEGIDFPRLRSS
ncbi:MAG TPA: hypothetical protein VHR18_07390 [Solirubrobacterales bacterium]|jgi:hypothetical protein|nr:hypothetical protein [Solirubrobacterales bacterium]